MSSDRFRVLRQRLMEKLDLARELSDQEILEEIDDLLLNGMRESALSLKEKVQLRQELFYSVRKLDVLQELIDDDSVTEIMVNGPDNIFVERAGKLKKWEKGFTSREKLEDVIQQIVGKCNRVINESMPICDARLENGARVNAVIRPVALEGPILTIRRFPDTPITMEKLISLGSLPPECAQFLAMLVKARYSMVIGGGTGSGKTTFLGALSNYIPKDERLITIEDRATEDGDTVIIDFDGYVDGKQFEGGYAEDYTLVLGSHSFIDNFEDQLVGKNLGEDVEVNVTFPEEYHVDELKGKPALFKVKIKEIQKKELPELDDDFAQDVSDFDTLDEYKADVEKKILENKENQIKREQEDQIIEKIIENAQMEIPQQMIAAQTRQMTQEFAQRLQSQGLSLEQYMQFTGLTPQKMMEDLEPQALKRIQSRLVLEAVVAAENIEASDEEIDKELENMASMYQMEIDKLKELIGDDEKKQIGMDLAVQKAVEFVVKEAVEK